MPLDSAESISGPLNWSGYARAGLAVVTDLDASCPSPSVTGVVQLLSTGLARASARVGAASVHCPDTLDDHGQ